jgi:hypothetical protein
MVSCLCSLHGHHVLIIYCGELHEVMFVSFILLNGSDTDIGRCCTVLCVGSWWSSSENMECDRWTSAGNTAWCISWDYGHRCQHRKHTAGCWQHRQDSTCVVPADHSTCESVLGCAGCEAETDMPHEWHIVGLFLEHSPRTCLGPENSLVAQIWNIRETKKITI